MNASKEFSFTEKALAWGVHTFTASGLVAGFMAILAINVQDWRATMLWLIICQIIDGIDGTFARMFNVKEVLPQIDGKTIDYVIDFATYAIIPAYFFHQANLVPESWVLWLTAIILLVSALYYGKTGMVTDDMYFWGFPVMWNMVVFCLVFVFQFPAWGNALTVLFFAGLHFAPIKFVYPSQASKFKKLTVAFTIIFILSLLAICWVYPDRYPWMIGASIASMCFFAFMAVYNTWIE